MKQTLSVLSVLAIASVVAAQSVTFSLLTPQTAQVTLAGVTQTVSLPAGPLAVPGGLQADLTAPNGDFARVSVGWQMSTQNTGVRLYFGQSSLIIASTPATGTLGSGGYLLQVSNPTAIQSLVRVSRTPASSPGLPQQSLDVDIRNDGSVELGLGSPNASAVALVTLGPTPLPILIQNQMTASGSIDLATDFTVEILPQGNILTTDAILGCGAHHHYALPTFDNGVALVTAGPLLGGVVPYVNVIGLAVQPILLGSVFGDPCVLLPRPDILVAVLAPAGQGFTLPLPAAVRPVTFWTQNVMLDPFGLGAGFELAPTNAVRVQAF